MVAIMLPMLAWHSATTHVAALLALCLLAIGFAAHTRFTGQSHWLHLVDCLVMVGLILACVLAPSAAHSAASHVGHGLGILPGWLLSVVFIAIGTAAHCRSLLHALSDTPVGALVHAALMALQITAMLWACA